MSAVEGLVAALERIEAMEHKSDATAATRAACGDPCPCVNQAVVVARAALAAFREGKPLREDDELAGWHDDGVSMWWVSQPVDMASLRRRFVYGDDIGPCDHGRDPYTRCHICDGAVTELQMRDAEGGRRSQGGP